MSQVPPAFIPPTFTPPTEPAPTILETDLACRKCGYNLRGLWSDGRCPECGAAVGLSIRGDLLRYSDPKWVRKLQRGVRMIIWALVVMILGGIVAAALAAAVGTAGIVGVALVMIVGYLFIIIGSWLMTEPDPSGVGEDRYGTSRKLIRISLIVGIVNTALQMIEAVVNVPPEVRIALELIGLAAMFVSVVGVFAQMDYLQKLAMRIPDDTLAGRAYFLKFALTGSYALFALMQAVILVTKTLPGGGGIACFMGILGLTMLVFGIMALLMLEKLGKRFGEEAAVAEQTWARPDAAAPAM